ncbi:MAG: hypothetical protein AB7F64_09065 [Gammaproteobacteria bacterium]
MNNVPFQPSLRPALPNVYGSLDYRNFRETLIKIDDMLTSIDYEHQLIMATLSDPSNNCEQSIKHDSPRLYKQLKHALRCTFARHLTGESYRAFSLRLADSTLFQWFTGTHEFDRGKGISKSALERYEKYFDEDTVKATIQRALNEFADGKKASEIGLNESIDFQDVWMDSTCVKSNIHFPIDWVLLRDATRSMLCTIQTIRKQGLKHRMPSPKSLSKQMNKYCIAMSQTRRKIDSKKQRKRILRLMKQLSQCIAKHAKRYRQLIEEQWTMWSEAQKDLVIARIDSILNQLPTAIKQAHERIIGERQVKSDEKLLSLYDRDCEVIVRGKAGSEVEFGQRLLLAEQKDGLLIDWELFSKDSLSDSHSIQPTVKRLQAMYGKVRSVCADRAFSSKGNSAFLKENEITNGVCPKSPTQLQEHLKDPLFVSLQTRRSQTESRIGIFKNVFLGKPLRSRILKNKRHAVNWCVLSHNLWVIARKAIANEQSRLKAAA